MELEFHEERLRFLAQTRCGRLCQELTAEMTVPETMPEIARVVDCFGTVTVQNRSVDSGSVSVGGGIQAGVLYVPEGAEGELQRIDVYLPFTATRKLPAPEGSVLFCRAWLRSVEARFINARKVLVRANLCSELKLLSPSEWAMHRLDRAPAGLECRQNVYPMCLPVCTAEKELQIADELLMPETCVAADSLLKWTADAVITDSKVVGDKAVFKGELRLRVLCRDEAGSVGAWAGAVPFSQYAELSCEPGEAAELQVTPLLRHAEVDTDGQIDSRRLLLNVTLGAQITVTAPVPVTLTEDAYYLGGHFAPEWETRTMEPLLDRQSATAELALDLPQEAEKLIDWTLLPDSPAEARGASELESAVWVNLLYRDGSGALQGQIQRCTARTGCSGAADSVTECAVADAGGAEMREGRLRLNLQADCKTWGQMNCRNLCGGTAEPGPTGDRPSLIVRRGSGQLWELAKENGSTVAALRAANGLDADALEEERLLLIPTGQAARAAKEEEG